MDRAKREQSEYTAAVRAVQPSPVGLVLPGSGRELREPALDEDTRRTVHGDTVLRRGTDDTMPSQPEVSRQSETRAAIDETNGIGGNLSETAAFGAGDRAQGLSVPASRSRDHEVGSGLEHRYHVHSTPTGVRLSGGDHRVAQSI